MRRNHKTVDEKIAEFWSRIDTSGDCHLYTGSRDVNGYGNFVKGPPKPLQVKAHRFAYELHTGERYPPWRPIRHLCSNRHCVRIEHLPMGREGTPKQYQNKMKGPRPHLWKWGPSQARKDLNMAFLRARAQAKFRSETWRMTFEDFEQRWEGRYPDTGVKASSPVMVRSDPRGAWSLSNTMIMSRDQNQRRMAQIKQDMGQPASYQFNNKPKGEQ